MWRPFVAFSHSYTIVLVASSKKVSDLASDFADRLRGLEGVIRALALEAQDKLTGVIGRALLLAA